jgi:DnaK suppressor protein
MDPWIKEAVVILSQERDALLDELEAIGDNVKPVLLDQSTQGRLSRADSMQRQAMAITLVERKKLALKKIDAALARCHSGTYGICCDCGELISRDRLAADPSTPFCSQCMAERKIR